MSNSASSPSSTPSDGTSSDSAPPPATQPPPSSDPSSSPPTLASSPTVAPPTDSNGSNSSPPTAPPGTPPPEKPPPSPPVPSPPANESPSNVPSPPVQKPSPTPPPPVSPPPQEVSVPPPTIKSHRASPPQPLLSPTPPAPIVAPPTPQSVPVPAPPKSPPPDQAVILPPPTTPSPVQPVPQPTTPTTPNANSTPAITPGNPSLPTPAGSNQSNSSVGDSNGSSLTPPPSGSAPPSGGFKVGAIIGIGTAGLGTVLIMVGVVYFYFSRKLKKKKSRFGSLYMPPKEGYYHNPPASVDSYYASKLPPSPSAVGNPYAGYGSYGYHQGLLESAGSKSTFTYEELAHITNGFSRENLLGEGGFGWVYMGSLPDGRNVAVKQLKAGGGQVEREFRAEVETISRVHHRHLVSLVGFCIAENHRVLVYEFVPNKTLEHHLHGKGLPVLDWPKRLKIAIGAARGLAYLHEGCHPRIIHRDIKSANILLDNSFEAQVADFGLAKLTNDANTHVSTRVMGTFGYMAPEYATSGKLTDRSDVFSFGVVLLELITGRKPIDPTQPPGNESLVEWARPLLVHALETGDYKELVDARLENNFVESEMLRMIEAAAACVRHSAPKRPSMVQVLRALDNNGDISDLSNGVKFGQSTVYNSSQYSADIRNFRRLAFAADECSMEYGQSSGEHSHQSSVLTGGFPNTEESHGPVCATSSTENSTDQRGSP